MITGRIAIVGSTNRGEVPTQTQARESAYELGQALARKGFAILVYYDEPIFAEAEVVRGYLDSGMAGLDSIEVRYPEKLDAAGVPKPPPFASHLKEPSFTFLPDKNREWEISFYESLGDIGGMLILQGGSSTLIAGLIALGYNKPLIACSGFGGTSVKLGSILAERGLITPAEKTHLQRQPDTASRKSWSDDCLKILVRQAQTIQAKRLEQTRAAASAGRRQTTSIITAALFGIVALVLCVLNWDNGFKLSPLQIRFLIFLVAGLSGATGAMLWSAVPFLRRTTTDAALSIWATSVLGLIVAGLTTLIYMIAQERGFPDLAALMAEDKIVALKADYLAKLLPSVTVTAVIAGLTLDRAFQSILKKRLPDD